MQICVCVFITFRLDSEHPEYVTQASKIHCNLCFVLNLTVLNLFEEIHAILLSLFSTQRSSESIMQHATFSVP